MTSSLGTTGDAMSGDVGASSAWARFWTRGGWWRSVLLAVVYLALYVGFQRVFGLLVGDAIDPDDVLADPVSVLCALVVPIAFGALLLLAFARSLGWLPRPLFGPQPVRGRWWMWAAPVLVAVPVVFHLLGTDYARYSAGTVAMTLVAGLAIGVAEEVLTRGLVVSMLRRRGYREWAVMVLSSLVFALLHASNLLSGQGLGTVGPTVLYAFGFGICMYLTLRVTGNLVWPVLLHALTDPTTMLATGGVDEAVAGTTNAFLAVATVGTLAYGVLALVAFVVVRGDAHGRLEATDQPALAPATAG